MIKKIIQIGDKMLFEESESIVVDSISSGEVQQLAIDLLDTVTHHSNSAAGLSAVQIGVLKRIFVVKRMDLTDGVEQWEIMINPTYKVKGSKETLEWEGCMSINKDNVKLFGPVYRPKEIEVTYYALDGTKKRLRAKNFFSHLIQHEIDHLNGLLFLSYVDNPKNIWNEKELDLYIKQNNSLPTVV